MQGHFGQYMNNLIKRTHIHRALLTSNANTLITSCGLYFEASRCTWPTPSDRMWSVSVIFGLGFDVWTEKPLLHWFYGSTNKPHMQGTTSHAKLRAHQAFHLRLPNGLLTLASFLDMATTDALLGVDLLVKPTNLTHETHNLTMPSFEHAKSFTSGSQIVYSILPRSLTWLSRLHRLMVLWLTNKPRWETLLCTGSSMYMI
jgi:hypothetical protein